jgi:single-strand DNA-binding protein
VADNNVVTLVGTLGADPDMRRTPTGKDVVSFTLVTNERIRDANGAWTDGAASWFKVTAWNQLARNAAMSLRKGQRVIARGTLKVETWQARDGGTGKTVALTAQALGHDLLWGTSMFVRGATRPAPQQAPADDPWGATGAQDPEDAPAEDADRAPEREPAWSTPMGEDETPF